MKQILVSQSSGTATTTTLDLRQSNRQWNKIRGFSVDILELLNDCGALSTIEIANRLDKKRKYVNMYLCRLRDYDLITLNRNDWKWYITATDDIILYIIYKDNRKTTERQQKENRNEDVLSLYKNNKMKLGKQKQTNIEDWQKERSELDRVVVTYLIDHFGETSNKFVLCTSHDEFAEMLNIPFPESTEIPKALIKLESDGVIYNVYLREKSAWKIGLKDAFINRIQFC